MFNYDQDDINSMALAVWKEARGEGASGMSAVANVIKNRANAWERAVTSPLHNVIFQKNQFTSMSVSSDPEFNLVPKMGDPQYSIALDLCIAILTDKLADNTNGALYYGYLKECTSGWFSKTISGPDGKGTVTHPLVATIGRQSFYK
jgi:N-acetylmuramoyl-L-alanine amidase